MIYVLLIAAALGVVFGPMLWTKWVLERHGRNRPDLPGTGGELAEHLVERFALAGVRVERTDQGSHYDPRAKAVRLEPQFYDGRSVSAVAVAAHEVGHAIQDFDNYTPLRTREVLIANTRWADRAATLVFYAAPVFGLLTRHPGIFAGMLAISVAVLGARFLVHLVTLPVEFNASFARALPVLVEGKYLAAPDLAPARAVLRAAALTYVSAALVSSFNLLRLIRLVR